MAAAVGENTPIDPVSAQRQIADQVEEFVPGAFVGKSQLIVDRSAGTKDHQVAVRHVLCKSAVLKFDRIALSQEGPSRCDRPEELLRAQQAASRGRRDRTLGSVI